MFRSKRAQAENLMATGARAVGTVTRVDDTGMTINQQPRVKLTFRIEPLDGSPPFEASKTSTVPRVQIPQIGARYPVWYDPQDPSTWAFAAIGEEAGRRQIAAMFGNAFGPDGSGIGMPAMPAAAQAAPAPAAAADDPIEQIRKLAELHQAGVLTDEEFSAKKAQLLAEL